MKFSRISEALAKKGYDFKKKFIPYATDVCDYLRRHDVVYQTPVKNGADGLFVGNGDFAAMIWGTNSSLEMQINKNDLWVFPDEEGCMLLRAAGQLKLDFGMPVFDQLFIDSYEARMDIAHEKVTFASECDFANITTVLFADPDKNLLYVTVKGKIDGETTLRMSMERYGSRGYRSWNSSARQPAASCMGLAESDAADGLISLYEPFDESGKVCCAMAASCTDSSAVSSRTSTRRAELSVPVSGDFDITFNVAVSSGSAESGVLASAKALLGESDVMASADRRDAWWSDFWNRSFVHLTKEGAERDFDYLENLYYIQNYLMGVSSRGRYPAPFNGGLCVWNHDIRQWVNPHHWNTQQAYWSLEEANRPELMKPYLDTYFNMMPQAREHALGVYGSEHGIAITEMHDFEGRMLAYHNAPTPTMQIGMFFWNHYLYNKDEKYLSDIAYPFISGCAELYTEYAKLDENTGKYNIGPVMPAESAAYDDLYNTVLDGSMARAILPAAIKASEILGVDSDRAAAWQNLLDNLFDFTYMRDYSPECPLGDMLGVGVMSDMKTVIGVSHGFLRSETPVMPAGVVGLRDKGTRIFNAVRYTAEKVAASALAITPMASLWARMGEGDKAVSSLFDAIDSLQHFSQGLFFNLDGNHNISRSVKEFKLGHGPRELALPFYQRDYIYDERSVYNNVEVCDSENNILRRVTVPTQAFAQCGLETPGILTHGYQELALQSHEGVIRIYPAFEGGYEGVFTLKAHGGFMVTGMIAERGVVPFAAVKSIFGGECVIDAPFEGLEIYTADGESVAFTKDEEGFVHFGTEKETAYFLCGSELDTDDIPGALLETETNGKFKSCRSAVIGKDICW